jgi:CheY-like chemotaxis protein
MPAKNIMIIDDSYFDRLIACKVIELANVEQNCISIDSALKALDYFGPQPDILPEIILLDISMPEMDGFGFLEELKKLQHDHKLRFKVIILSSSADPDDHKKAAQYPFVIDFILKPLTVQKVLDSFINR